MSEKSTISWSGSARYSQDKHSRIRTSRTSKPFREAKTCMPHSYCAMTKGASQSSLGVEKVWARLDRAPGVTGVTHTSKQFPSRAVNWQSGNYGRRLGDVVSAHPAAFQHCGGRHQIRFLHILQPPHHAVSSFLPLPGSCVPRFYVKLRVGTLYSPHGFVWSFLCTNKSRWFRVLSFMKEFSNPCPVVTSFLHTKRDQEGLCCLPTKGLRLGPRVSVDPTCNGGQCGYWESHNALDRGRLRRQLCGWPRGRNDDLMCWFECRFNGIAEMSMTVERFPVYFKQVGLRRCWVSKAG